MKHATPTIQSPAVLRLLPVLAAAGLVFAASPAAAQTTPATTSTSATATATARGNLIVLGLRAPDGDDAAAANMTTALRAAGSRAGFTVPADSPALEQSMAMFSCDESVPISCVRQINTDLGREKMMYGTVRRNGTGRQAPLRFEILYFDPAADRTSAPQTVELPQTALQDPAQVSEAANRIVQALLPPPPPVTTTATTATTTTSASASTSADTSAVPIRRYIGFGAVGLGAIGIVGGIVFGGLWAGFHSSQQQENSAWLNYRPDLEGGAAVCTAAATDNSMEGMNARGVCAQHSTLQAGQWAMLTLGVVFAAAGVILIVTDNTGKSSTPARTATPPRRRYAAPLVGFTPALSPTYQGASLELRF